MKVLRRIYRAIMARIIIDDYKEDLKRNYSSYYRT